MLNADAIRALARPLLRGAHPDRPTGQEELFKLISQADNVLRDEPARLAYHELLAFTATPCPNCHTEGVIWRQQGFTRRFVVQCVTCGGSGHLIEDVEWNKLKANS